MEPITIRDSSSASESQSDPENRSDNIILQTTTHTQQHNNATSRSFPTAQQQNIATTSSFPTTHQQNNATTSSFSTQQTRGSISRIPSYRPSSFYSSSEDEDTETAEFNEELAGLREIARATKLLSRAVTKYTNLRVRQRRSQSKSEKEQENRRTASMATIGTPSAINDID